MNKETSDKSELDKEALVEIVLKKVLEEILKKSNLENSNEFTAVKNIPSLIYLGDDILLKDELQKKVEVIDNVNIKTSFKELPVDKNDKLLVADLCINNLIKLSQGKKNLITEFLLNGKEVYLVEEGLEYKKYKEPASLIKIYDEYLEKVKTFGIKVVKRNEITDIFQEKKEIYIDGIITETKLKSQNLKNKVIILKRNSKVTSLAQDYIKQNNIEVRYERGQ